jgi:membrane associated rhomboid family serine protease
MDKKIYGTEAHNIEKILTNKTAEKTAGGILAVIGILGGLFLLSPNLTGNAISNLDSSTTNIIGIFILIFGFIGLYFFLRNNLSKTKKRVGNRGYYKKSY